MSAEVGAANKPAIAPATAPATGIVQLAENGEPWLRGFRCSICGAVVAEQTMCCRACGARAAPEPVQLSPHGKLFTWSVVHRSFPGVAVPFISAIVDFDDGLTIKGTLRGIELESLHAGLLVTAVFDDAGGAKSAEGGGYVGFHLEPVVGEVA